MAVGDHGKATQTTSPVPGAGPVPGGPDMAKHIRGSGDRPGTGPSSGPSDQAPENVHKGLS